ncbi:hypothetical protein MMPV_005508 [Pyropia vietnamensis]
MATPVTAPEPAAAGWGASPTQRGHPPTAALTPLLAATSWDSPPAAAAPAPSSTATATAPASVPTASIGANGVVVAATAAEAAAAAAAAVAPVATSSDNAVEAADDRDGGGGDDGDVDGGGDPSSVLPRRRPPPPWWQSTTARRAALLLPVTAIFVIALASTVINWSAYSDAAIAGSWLPARCYVRAVRVTAAPASEDAAAAAEAAAIAANVTNGSAFPPALAPLPPAVYRPEFLVSNISGLAVTDGSSAATMVAVYAPGGDYTYTAAAASAITTAFVATAPLPRWEVCWVGDRTGVSSGTVTAPFPSVPSLPTSASTMPPSSLSWTPGEVAMTPPPRRPRPRRDRLYAALVSAAFAVAAAGVLATLCTAAVRDSAEGSAGRGHVIGGLWSLRPLGGGRNGGARGGQGGTDGLDVATGVAPPPDVGGGGEGGGGSKRHRVGLTSAQVRYVINTYELRPGGSPRAVPPLVVGAPAAGPAATASPAVAQVPSPPVVEGIGGETEADLDAVVVTGSAEWSGELVGDLPIDGWETSGAGDPERLRPSPAVAFALQPARPSG